jgi:hypothetical protein
MHICTMFGYNYISYYLPYKEITTLFIRSRSSSQVPYRIQSSFGVSMRFSVHPGHLYYSFLCLLISTFPLMEIIRFHFLCISVLLSSAIWTSKYAFALFRRRCWACCAHGSSDISAMVMFPDLPGSLMVRVACNTDVEGASFITREQ